MSVGEAAGGGGGALDGGALEGSAAVGATCAAADMLGARLVVGAGGVADATCATDADASGLASSAVGVMAIDAAALEAMAAAEDATGAARDDETSLDAAAPRPDEPPAPSAMTATTAPSDATIAPTPSTLRDTRRWPRPTFGSDDDATEMLDTSDAAGAPPDRPTLPCTTVAMSPSRAAIARTR